MARAAQNTKGFCVRCVWVCEESEFDDRPFTFDDAEVGKRRVQAQHERVVRIDLRAKLWLARDSVPRGVAVPEHCEHNGLVGAVVDVQFELAHLTVERLR